MKRAWKIIDNDFDPVAVVSHCEKFECSVWQNGEQEEGETGTAGLTYATLVWPAGLVYPVDLDELREFAQKRRLFAGDHATLIEAMQACEDACDKAENTG